MECVLLLFACFNYRGFVGSVISIVAKGRDGSSLAMRNRLR
jgi:hypothetical protein